MILNALLAFGIVMSSATQLVVPHFSSTVGEASLLLWIVISVGLSLMPGQIQITPALARLSGFWLIFAMLLAVGLVIGFTSKVLYAPYVLHDSVAYILLALITCLCAAKPNAAHHLRQTAWFIIGFASLTFAVQLLIGLGFFSIQSVSPWYWNRFRGWSQNPNQLALYCAIYGPIALHLATSSKTVLARIAAFGGLSIAVTVGVMTKSDTYVVTAILTCIIFIGLWLRRYLSAATAGARNAPGRQLAILLLLAAPPFIVAMAPYETASVGSLVNSVTRDRGGLGLEETTERRRALWGEALENGLLSGSLGLGPGPHQEIRPLNEPLYEDNPFEAHNTFLDVYTQGGLLAVCLLIWLGVTAARSVLRAQLYALFGLTITLAFFAIPHLIIRHPIVWFAITLCLVAGGTKLQSSRTQRASAF